MSRIFTRERWIILRGLSSFRVQSNAWKWALLVYMERMVRLHSYLLHSLLETNWYPTSDPWCCSADATTHILTKCSIVMGCVSWSPQITLKFYVCQSAKWIMRNISVSYRKRAVLIRKDSDLLAVTLEKYFFWSQWGLRVGVGGCPHVFSLPPPLIDGLFSFSCFLLFCCCSANQPQAC